MGLSIEEQDPAQVGIDLSAVEELVGQLGPLAVIDLETTGLPDDPAAEILEFGLVLLDPGRVATFQSLVRPSQPLSLLIQRLTGLCDEDVADAPMLRTVAPVVRDALAGRTLIAHNAEFERTFLTRCVDSRLDESSYLDTQDLLALTHPDAPDLRLESFTRMLLGAEEQHRALEDALDTARVLSRIGLGVRQGEARYLTASRAVLGYAPSSPWLALLGKELVVEDDEPSQFVHIGESREKPVPFDEDAIAEALADEERGRRYLPGYRARAEQVELARQFVRALDDGGALLIEGGTGVGKSLAYLAAAIPFAMERAAGGVNEPVVISTRTKLLQDQLLLKDIAAAARFLGHPDLRALSIKGRANYVCERRLESVLAEGREPSIFEADRMAYAVMLGCARTRPHGEVGTLPAALLRRYPPLRDLRRRSVATRAQQCSREECARQRSCPFGRRRAGLAKAHLVVANHDLLLRWPPDYPPFTHAIVDEGHELAGVADEVYAITVRPDEVLEAIDEIYGRSGERNRSGLLPRSKTRAAAKDVVAWRRSIALDLSALGRTLADHASEYGEVQLPQYPEKVLPEAAALAETAARRLGQVADHASSLDDGGEEWDEAGEGMSAVAKVVGELREAAHGLRLAFADESGDSVSAFERLEPPYDRWRLAIRAVSPAAAFHESFLQRLESFTAVSASLFVGGDAFAALGELEVEERSLLPTGRVSVESPFPYAEHMRVAVLKTDADQVVPETAAVIADLARALGGRTLGLFTSLRRMNQVAELLDQELRGEGFEILAPRRASDDPAALVQRFTRVRGGAILLGARTFWQGLDIPGEDLQAVVIEKLPFEVPTELRKRREARIRESGGSPFERFALGKMLLHLKQMTGRLIRSEEDRGIVVIVDGRPDRRYFAKLQQALPRGVAVRVALRSELSGMLQEIGLQAKTVAGDQPGP
ncbi:MAG: helicase C-terminal domain-containing protein [Myxococcota bacterium]|nr:helicase C-terminal domain-containing protein [Myxococcota bacterium]